jgi:hypothetical protein
LCVRSMDYERGIAGILGRIALPKPLIFCVAGAVHRSGKPAGKG